ncbi:MAG: hypothetical protein HY829_09640 [Actinobacteria bacterium]|nr:hypothetical protein [Actinomycetota bacterium]
MSTTGAPPIAAEWPVIPVSAWALAWSFVAGQVLELARRGSQDESSWPLSILLGVAVVSFVSHGVMRVRWVRFWLVVVLLVGSAVVALFDVVNDPTPVGGARLALTILQIVLLDRYSRTEWFARQASRRPGAPSLSGIMLVAALVGALGGVLGSSPDGIGAYVDLG